ncbi:MAG: hypothetical protein PVF28_05420 [Thioalkalispiraceae bacterium]|jgi:hypothetical protein
MSEPSQAKDEKTYLFDNPKNVSRLLLGFYIICAVLFVLDFIVHRHSVHPWEGFPAFYAIYGFVACVLLVLIAKEMRKLIMRKEDYYDVDE